LDNNPNHQAVQAQENAPTQGAAKHASKSRLYWEIKAEQTLNKVFDQCQAGGHSASSKPFTDVEIIDFAPSHEQQPVEKTQQSKSNAPPNGKLWIGVTASGLVTMLLIPFLLTSRQQQALEQESNLRLLSLLRQPQATERAQDPSEVESTHTSQQAPPSPPGEEWIQDLAKLPPSENTSADLLKVPLHGTLKSTGPLGSKAQKGSDSSSGNRDSMPTLVGIVQGVGTSGSAIFQWKENSTNVKVGETIGTSGWRLQTANEVGAVIERGGLQRRLSINDGT
jgi:hypothetical protein